MQIEPYIQTINPADIPDSINAAVDKVLELTDQLDDIEGIVTLFSFINNGDKIELFQY